MRLRAVPVLPFLVDRRPAPVGVVRTVVMTGTTR